MDEIFKNPKWRVEIHEAEEGGYWGEVPALPGCASDGATREECLSNVLEALQGCLETYFEMAMERAKASYSPSPEGELREAVYA